MIQEFKRIFTKKRKRLYPLYHWKIRQSDGVLHNCWQSGVCGLWEVVHKAPLGHTWTQGQGPFSSTGVLQMSALSSAGWLIDYRHTFEKWTVRKHVFLHNIVHCPVFQKQGKNWESDGIDRVKVLVDEGAHSMNMPPKCLLLRASSEQRWQKTCASHIHIQNI